ncbi:MAG: peptidylprolyl isomerase [Chitinivibrionales bacterium]|nr:peptidylprolyl isomerase [Chitinivibrionales bacterium]MBD3356242.1 peptidylprolyl isomerase [Chitinivibrionales bacterium]
MHDAKRGSHVRVRYRGTLARHHFGKHNSGKTAEFTIGEHRVLRGVEDAVIGMREGETKSVMIPAGKAYGRHRSELVTTIHRSRLPVDMIPETGKWVYVQTGGGERIRAQIHNVTDTTVVLDANHPLAGRDLKFEIELLEIERRDDEEHNCGNRPRERATAQ